MKNYVQAGNDLTLDAPADVSSGDGVLIGAIFGVAAVDAVSGDPVDIRTRGVFSLPKAAVAVAIGDLVYWDDTAKVATTDDDTGGNPKIGVAVAAAIDSAAKATVRLNGAF